MHKSINWLAKGAEEKPLSNEFTSLHRIYQGENVRYMDGVLCYGEKRRYVQRVPFKTLSVGGYGDQDLHTIGSEIWIQSIRGRKSDIWYRLKSPAPEYQRYHEPFLWIADLTKHVIDYMNEHKMTSIFDFRSHFFTWLKGVHGSSDVFQSWHSKYSNTDFRRAVASYSGFLYYQAMQLDPKYALHPLWAETDAEALAAVPDQRSIHNPFRSTNSTSTATKTVVTPYVFQCFEHLPFARFLDAQDLAPPVLRNRNQKLLNNNFSTGGANHPTRTQQGQELGRDFAGPMQVSIGDVIAIRPDKVSSWKHNDHLWYGYVQGVQDMRKGRSLKIIWLYRPTDTACQKMKYPFSNELFLGDHCNCDDNHTYASEVVYMPKVAFFAGPDTDSEFFVRQKYIGADAAWVTLQKSDFECNCKAKCIPMQYFVGDTLLVAVSSPGSDRVLEAVEVTEKILDGDAHHLRVRRLLRRARDCGQADAEPNELVYSDNFEVISVKDVVRSCNVRFYTGEDKLHRRIPSQYRRGGIGDLFYITHHLPWPTLMKQGWNPADDEIQASPRIMRGLDIFCGGGNLGRGLEEGGAVKFKWAVDYFKEAIHTYRANLTHPDDAELFYGSVNDYLSQAMRGDASVASPGAVEVISAGSPCQGFSNANQWKNSDQALLNVSMVASVVSFIDFYRPKYALLENVTTMAKCNAKDSGDNVFAQVLSALLGMGYQARSFILDAWNFGSPQSRTRLFISIAAPGLVPLSAPPQSHSHPTNIVSRSLGKSANGLPFANRYWDDTPFSYVTIGEATKDLPLNHDGRVECIPFPDHRPSRQMSTTNRVRLSCIPRFPPGMNFVKAARLGQMPPPQMAAFNWNADKRARPEGRTWQRVNQNGLISTVITKCQPDDGLCGAWVHWDASRCITIMEVRRAQGFPDEEVILGVPNAQWKIIGNSVARPVAFALGLALRTAWLTNSAESDLVPHLKLTASSVSTGSRAGTVSRKQRGITEHTKLDSNELHSKPTPKSSSKPSPRLSSIPSALTTIPDKLSSIRSRQRIQFFSPTPSHNDDPHQRPRHSQGQSHIHSHGNNNNYLQPSNSRPGSTTECDTFTLTDSQRQSQSQSTAQTSRSISPDVLESR